jgi:hypothetical protein
LSWGSAGQPFTRWSIRKLAAYLRKVLGRVNRIGLPGVVEPTHHDGKAASRSTGVSH